MIKISYDIFFSCCFDLLLFYMYLYSYSCMFVLLNKICSIYIIREEFYEMKVISKKMCGSSSTPPEKGRTV